MLEHSTDGRPYVVVAYDMHRTVRTPGLHCLIEVRTFRGSAFRPESGSIRQDKDSSVTMKRVLAPTPSGPLADTARRVARAARQPAIMV
ncbi:hypothetical protein C5E05_00065 [Pseudoclavibacter sp. AY1H1]|nr:hypothetical protein C5E05_00065 [Pseudoclavibacter sp. AY1H1]